MGPAEENPPVAGNKAAEESPASDQTNGNSTPLKRSHEDISDGSEEIDNDQPAEKCAKKSIGAAPTNATPNSIAPTTADGTMSTDSTQGSSPAESPCMKKKKTVKFVLHGPVPGDEDEAPSEADSAVGPGSPDETINGGVPSSPPSSPIAEKAKASSREPTADKRTPAASTKKTTPKKESPKKSPKSSKARKQPATPNGPRQSKRIKARKPSNQSTSTTPSTLPTPPPISTNLAAQIARVQTFLTEVDQNDSVLDRDPQNPKIINCPITLLNGAFHSMRTGYELPPSLEHEQSADGVYSLLETLILKRWQKPFGESTEVPFLTVDVSKGDEIFSELAERMANLGLKGVNLLEVEMELVLRDQLIQLGLLEAARVRRDAKFVFTAEAFVERFMEIQKRMSDSSSSVSSSGDEVEAGVKGAKVGIEGLEVRMGGAEVGDEGADNGVEGGKIEAKGCKGLVM